MALRLTTTQLEPEPETPQSLEAAATAMLQSLVDRAAALLASDEIPAYLELFGEAQEIANEQRRYQARKHLIEQALAATRAVNERRAITIYLAVVTAAVGVLEQTPAEPLLLNYAGIAFYELWGL